MDLEQATKKLVELIRPLGRNAYQNIGSMTIKKEYDQGADISTNFDQEIEKAIYEFVSKQYPETGFMGEEFPNLRHDAEYVWYVDPIDGTKWFKNNVPLWCISIALVKKMDMMPVLGLIYNPSSDQLYFAYKDGGSFLNGKRLSLSEEIEPMKIQVALDLSSHKHDWDTHKKFLSETVVKLIQKFYRVRSIGSGALSLAWVAQGMFGAFVNPYRHKQEMIDTAAGMIIAFEAGAQMWRNDLGGDIEQLIIAKSEVIEEIKSVIELKI